MRYVLLAAVIFSLVLTGAGCKKDESNPSGSDLSQFSDKLTLGTGMSGFNIVGESSSFVRVGGSATVFWRLESAADMAGSTVRIRIDRQSAGSYVPFDSVSFTNPQSYGHIMLSSFSAASAGNFRATGILVATGRSVASKDFAVN